MSSVKTNEKWRAVETALTQIERQFGKGSVMRMSDAAQVSIGAVSTGSLSLDLALGIGGLPRLEPFVTSDAAAFLSRLRPGGARYEVLESVEVGGR